MKSAACVGMNVDIFFPESGGGAAETAQVAKAICARCEVTGECLAYARSLSIREGIWGGLSERERRRRVA